MLHYQRPPAIIWQSPTPVHKFKPKTVRASSIVMCIDKTCVVNGDKTVTIGG